jgi:hypothetical protein
MLDLGLCADGELTGILGASVESPIVYCTSRRGRV